MSKLIFTLISGFLLISSSMFAQVGIGTLNPNSSAVLDLTSQNQGFLLPRLSTGERDLINNPATGLMIYNNSNSEIQVNIGTPEIPIWVSMNENTSTNIFSITDEGDLSTNATAHELIPGMELTPPAGTYLVFFNGQFGLLASVPISTQQGVIDLGVAYDELMDIPATNTTHPAIFGNDEILMPGVYDVAGATSLAGTLFMNGGGDSTSVFIIRSGGALNSGAGTTVVLSNGARARNIYWISEGALGLGANTIMKGTLIAHNAAISAAAGSNLEGRMFSTTGAVSFGPGTAYVPAGNSYVVLGVLSTFVMFTSSGAVANTEPSYITGDVGTNLGAITGFEQLNGNVYGPGANPSPVNNTLVTFSVYLNGELLANSSRTTDINTSVISLQALANVGEGESLDIRWHVDTGGVVIGNRILSLVKSN